MIGKKRNPIKKITGAIKSSLKLSTCERGILSESTRMMQHHNNID